MLVKGFAREELQRDSSTELGVLGFIDDTRAAFAELLGDSVMQYGPTDHDRRIVALSDR